MWMIAFAFILKVAFLFLIYIIWIHVIFSMNNSINLLILSQNYLMLRIHKSNHCTGPQNFRCELSHREVDLKINSPKNEETHMRNFKFSWPHVEIPFCLQTPFRRKMCSPKAKNVCLWQYLDLSFRIWFGIVILC